MTRERGLAHMAALAMSYALSRKLKPGPLTISTHSHGELLMQDDPILAPIALGLPPNETIPAGTTVVFQAPIYDSHPVPVVNPEVEAARPVLKTMEDLRQLPLRDRPKPPAGANRQTSRRYQHAERVTFGMALDQITAKKAAKEARRAKDKATAKMKKKARK